MSQKLNTKKTESTNNTTNITIQIHRNSKSAKIYNKKQTKNVIKKTQN